MTGRAVASGLVLVLIAAACAGDEADTAEAPATDCPAPDTTHPFVEVGCGLGLTQEALGEDRLLHNFAGGASVADYDGDGWLDVYVTGSTAPDHLYRNLGGEGFEDVTAAAGLVEDPPSGASVWGDVDGDGCLDLYVTSVGPARHHLYVSDCRGGFREEAVERGVDLATDELDDQFPDSQSFGAAFSDIDRDGDLDLFSGQWRLREHDLDEIPARNRLFTNDGTGHFTDVTTAAGLEDLDASTFTPTFADVDGDGWDDLLLAADFGTSRVLISDDGRRFADRTRAYGAGTDENGMGSVVTDLDGDERLDWFVTSIFRDPSRCDPSPTALEGCTGNRLFLGSDGTFVDATDRYGVRAGAWGWGADAFDVDLDADLDLGMTNQSPAPDQGVAGDPSVFWRNDDGRFHEVAADLGLDTTVSGKSYISFDVDRDGDLDVLVSSTYDGVALYRNDLATEARWLAVRPRGRAGNPDGIGATVLVQAEPGGPVQRRDIRSGDTYLGTRPFEAHVGLGDHEGAVHRVTVLWADTRQPTVVRDVAPDQVLEVVQPG